MPALRDILINIPNAKTTGDLSTVVNGLFIDSRIVTPGSAFIAVRGTLSDGHSYISKATELGATAIVCETLPAELKAGMPTT